MLREDLASDFAGTILDSVKENGLLRTISEDVGINRSEFNRKGIAGMKLFRVLRILVGLAFYMEPDRWMKCWRLLGDYIFEMAHYYYDDYCDERRHTRRAPSHKQSSTGKE